ncbi:MAG: DUF3566 domain-containing protein [Corynebacterium sp.]|uniref:DUF3566 domain-containing protein n=1 Tax=Corynebacterium sp. TaxID=1720 RepID=UPI003F98E635
MSSPRSVTGTVTAVSPWSALKVGAILSFCLWVAWMVAAALIYILLGVGGIWDRMNDLLADLIGADRISSGMFFGVAAGIGLLEFIVVTLLSPVVAVLYNAAAGLVGGLRVTVDGDGSADVPAEVPTDPEKAAPVASGSVADTAGESAPESTPGSAPAGTPENPS